MKKRLTGAALLLLSLALAFWPAQAEQGPVPLPGLPDPPPANEQALIERDWRKQDGIGTERNPSTYAAAVALTLERGERLLRDLQAGGTELAEEAAAWQRLRRRADELTRAGAAPEDAWESLWRQVHALRRRVALSNPLARTGPVVFVKQCPPSFSHQLTQYLGRFARPGGGLFVLEAPGRSMKVRRLAGQLPEGSCQHPDVSYDGKKVLFSYCKVAAAPKCWNDHGDHYYHLYEAAADGSGLKQLTGGCYNDFAPRYLPDGRIVFVSTRRGGWHRCGGRPGEGCENHTLALADANGSGTRPVSFHETQEWDPTVLEDGRILYTRWDYVDRHAVFYQQLFTARPDGSAAASFYGNNTFNSVGLWEFKPSGRITNPSYKKQPKAGSIQRPGAAGGLLRLGRPRRRLPRGQQRAAQQAGPLRRPWQPADEAAAPGAPQGGAERGRHGAPGDVDGYERALLWDI